MSESNLGDDLIPELATIPTTGPVHLAGSTAAHGVTNPPSASMELNRANHTAALDMNNSAVRRLAARTSGTISFSHFRGKANAFVINLPGGTHTDMTIDRYLGGYKPGTPIIVNVPSNAVYLASATRVPALRCVRADIGPGSKLNIASGAQIRGRGGIGGKGGNADRFQSHNGSPGGGGGTGLQVSRHFAVANSGIVTAGGGGGGGCYARQGSIASSGGGGGGGAANGAGGQRGNAVSSGGAIQLGEHGRAASQTAGGGGGRGGPRSGTLGNGGNGGGPGANGATGYPYASAGGAGGRAGTRIHIV